MYRNVIFVDFENLQKIDTSILNSNSKLIVMVGLGQDDKAIEFAKSLFNNLCSIELIKVNGRGPNALDIFIAFYIGKYFNDIKNTEIIICSNDTDYDQLIKHLDSFGLSIKRINNTVEETKKIESKTAKKHVIEQPKQKINNTVKKAEKTEKQTSAKPEPINSDIQTVVEYLKKQMQTQKKNRPKKKTTLENYLFSHFTKKISLDMIKNQ